LLTANYAHALRIITGGITSTPYTGKLSVMADPFVATAVAVKRETQVVNLVGKVPRHNVM
jgi:hypothetical protein